MFVIRKKLSATEGLEPATRYDETCECVQSTFDGGVTWVDNPAADPRTNPAYMTPAAEEDCSAAQGVANFVRSFIDGALQAFTVAGISSWAISIGLLWLPPLALLYRVAWIVAEGIVAVGSTTLIAVFTETVYDQIRDIAFCHLNAEGKFEDQAAFDAFGAQLQEDIGGSAFNITMALMFNLYGFVGFSNAAIKYAESADCSGAECAWCYEVPLSELPKDGITYQLNFGYGSQAACGLQTTDAGLHQIINAQIFFPAAVLTDLQFVYETGAGAGGAARQWDMKNNGGHLRDGTLNNGSGVFTLSQSAINVEVDEFYFSLDTLNAGGLRNCGMLLRLMGDGVNPFPESNC